MRASRLEAQSVDLASLLGEGSSVHAEIERFDFDGEGVFQGVTLLGNVHLRTRQYEVTADGVRLIVTGTPEALAYRLLAIGNILFLQGRQSFRAETLVLDGGRRRAVFTAARLRIDIEYLKRAARHIGDRDLGVGDALPPNAPPQPTEPGRVVLAAEVLESENFEHFFGQGVEFTTCDFVAPHFALTATAVEVHEHSAPSSPRERDPEDEILDAAGRREAPGGEADGRHYRVDTRGLVLEVGRVPLLPLPSLSWSTRWHRYVPLRRISYSNSSRFGNRVRTLWDGNVVLPRVARSWIDLGLRVEYLSDRGIGYGADLEYGVKPRRWRSDPGAWGDHYGEGLVFAIHDRGKDRVFGISSEPQTSDRHRERFFHRSRLSWGTFVDLEYAVESDPTFLGEYYEAELRGQKEPENLAYLRHYLGESAALTLLGKKRAVSYRTTLERRPELSLFLMEQPLGSSGFDLDLTARASELDFRPAENLPLPKDHTQRADLLATLAYAMGRSNQVKLRPFFTTRFTAYEEDLARGNAIERLSLATGARLGTHLQRTFAGNVLGFSRIRHSIDPEVSYRLVFENNVDPTELFPYDETDTVDRFERITLGVRNYVFGAHPIAGSADVESGYATRKLIESDLEIDYFPDPGRDNQRDPWGPLRGELLVYPHPSAGFFADGEYDVEVGGRFDELNTGVTLSGDAGHSITVSNRFRKHTSHSLLTSARWIASPKYEFDALLEYDFRRRRTVNQYYSVLRNFHRFACVFTLEIDEGEDNVTFKVQFAPRELLNELRQLDD